ncbi:MAG: flavodoxin family protein [Endomicrobiales bacterium]
MAKQILVISGSPKKDGNTETLVRWFSEGAAAAGAEVSLVRAAFLKFKGNGCLSCRRCQKKDEYGCLVDDDARAVLGRMAGADVIVMATPLYFFSASAQLKVIVDRMFSLYKWDNEAGTMETVLRGKTLVLLASAYEGVGLEALEKPFKLTADYSGMEFKSLLVPDAGLSGDIGKIAGLREKAAALGREAAG